MAKTVNTQPQTLLGDRMKEAIKGAKAVQKSGGVNIGTFTEV
jgi:hypothetical protein